MRFAPPIVAVVDPTRRMHRKRDPIRVGVVPWPREQDRTTIVVKATYTFEPSVPEPQLVLCHDQPPLTRAAKSKARGASEMELTAPDDLALEKPFTDILLVGHAYAPQAQEKIDAEVQIVSRDGTPRLALAFSTVGPSPIERMPLRGEYLRDTSGEVPIPPVGPLGPRQVERDERRVDAFGRDEEAMDRLAAIAGDPEKLAALRAFKAEEDPVLKVFAEAVSAARLADADPLTLGAVDMEDLIDDDDAPYDDEEDEVDTWSHLARAPWWVDSGVQFAGAQLTCAQVEPDDVLMIRGLSLGGLTQRVQLPNEVALVVLEGDKARFDVEMAIDTLLVDTDHGRIALTWRGFVPEDVFASHNLRMLVALASRTEEPELAELYRYLPLAHFFRGEVGAEHVYPDGEIRMPRGQDVFLEAARARTFGFTPDPRLGLEAYAELAARLGRDPNARLATLEASDFDETEWMLEERGWANRVGEALRLGDMDRVREINGALTHARRQLADEPSEVSS